MKALKLLVILLITLNSNSYSAEKKTVSKSSVPGPVVLAEQFSTSNLIAVDRGPQGILQPHAFLRSLVASKRDNGKFSQKNVNKKENGFLLRSS